MSLTRSLCVGLDLGADHEEVDETANDLDVLKVEGQISIFKGFPIQATVEANQGFLPIGAE